MYLHRYKKHTKHQKGPKGNYPQHIVAETTNVQDKENMMKDSRGKLQITHKRKPLKKTAEHSVETLKARRFWRIAFQFRLLYPAKLLSIL